MSDTILAGDFTVYYSSDNNRKQIVYTGSTATDTVRQLYSALQDLFDDLNQMDDQIPMSAQTPTEFTLINGWFIDRTSTEFLTGGAITTNGWASNEIVRVEYTESVSLIASDIGLDVNTTSYNGTLVDFEETESTTYLWIRPDDPGTDLFDSAEAFTIVTGTGTGSIVVATNLTGENLWANVFTIGSIVGNTTIYIYQGGNLLTSYKNSTDWWSEGQIDILVLVSEVGVEIDDGEITVLARRGMSLYDNFIVDLTNGGRNPIPLATAVDLNDAAGYREFDTDAETGGGWAAGDVGTVITDDTDATKTGIITSISGTGPNYTVQYYLTGDPQTDFVDDDIVEDVGLTKDMTVFGAPSDVNGNSAAAAAVTITHANASEDLNNGNGAQPYSITIDCNAQTLAVMYSHIKYTNRRGETGTTKTDGIEGEQYIGNDKHISYSAQTGSFVEGEQLWLHDTGDVLVASGIVVADHTTLDEVILRNTRIYTSNPVTQLGDNVVVGSYSDFATVDTDRVINPVKASPFGTFAGGTFFGAPGVWITNYAADQVFQLTDDLGVVQLPPTTVTVNVTNTRLGDRVSVFRTLGTGLALDKDDYAGTAQSAGAITAIMGSAISSEAPPDGALRLVDTSLDAEYRMRYTSYTASTFTLFTITGLTADGSGCTSVQITDTGANFVTNLVQVGDLLRNTTESVIAYVTSVDSESVLQTTPVTDWTSDSYEIGVLPVATTTSDDFYVPFVDIYETVGTDGTPGSEFDTLIYSTDIDVIVRVRQASAILPFETEGVIGSSGLSVATIRVPDTIYT